MDYKRLPFQSQASRGVLENNFSENFESVYIKISV